jgi:hypothetical protein
MIRALLSGLIGACTLTATHQLLKRTRPDAPSLDKLGMQSLNKVLNMAGVHLNSDELFRQSLLGELILNTLYFSQVGENKGLETIAKGVTLGVTMGAGAVSLPAIAPVDGKTVHKNYSTALITIGLYALSGLSAALAAQAFGRNK